MEADDNRTAEHGELIEAATEAHPIERVTSEEMAEVTALAGRLANACRKSVSWYQKEYGYTKEAAVEAAFKSNDFLEREFHDSPPGEVTWRDFDAAMEKDPERAWGKWEEIKEAAKQYRLTGQASADALEGHDSSPWQRARFLMVRNTLLEDWQPKGTESLLVDLMAEAFFEQERWTRIMVNHLSFYDEQENKTGAAGLPRLTQAAAIDQASQQVDRWNRIFLRNLRALRDLRRSSVIINNHPGGQVNIGEKQVNVSMDRGEE